VTVSHARVSVLLGSVLAFAPPPAAGQGPQIAHDAVGCVVAGQFPRFEARIEAAGGVGRARVLFRADGSSAWYFVEMKAAAGTWTGVLPKPTPALKRFSYYLEATGTSFEEGRTPEYAPRVVGAASECEPRALVAAVSAVGPALVGAPVGAPAVPVGFTGLGPAPVAGTVATSGSVAAGGGGSTGLVLGLVGGAAALGGGIAIAAGGSGEDGSASSTGSSSTGGSTAAPGTGAATGTRVPQSLDLALSNNCTLTGGVAIYAGDTVRVARGMCDWTTRAEAQAACAGQTASLTIDGVPLAPVLYFIGYDGTNGLVCSSAEADWKAAAGRHVAAGIWTLPGSPLHSCAVDVQP
jgi:hypothetical protein